MSLPVSPAWLLRSAHYMSSNQLSRVLGVTLKSAWFMSHRIREAMRDGSLAPMGGEGQIVEADETYFGPKSEVRTETTRGRAFTKKGKSGPSGKRAVVALVQRGGNVRSFHVENADKRTVATIVVENVAREAKLYTDESRLYLGADAHVSEHESIKHSAKEYVRGDIHTNTVEGVFSIFKRGMKGVYQHCGEKHLHRYLVLLRHKLRSLLLGFLRAQQGHRGTFLTRAKISLRRMVAIEFGM